MPSEEGVHGGLPAMIAGDNTEYDENAVRPRMPGTEACLDTFT
jgi:hypothetical protein